MKLLVKIVYIITSILFLAYLILPNPEFPTSPQGSIQSDEPADVETPFRRGYYTNSERNAVIENYIEQYKTGLYKYTFLTERLNYPPEEAQTIIRDQTRSTYLEEIVHPFRESLFINGFEPKKDNERILVAGEPFKQKIIIKQVNSSILMRLVIGLFSVFLIPFILIQLLSSVRSLLGVYKNLWTSQ